MTKQQAVTPLTSITGGKSVRPEDILPGQKGIPGLKGQQPELEADPWPDTIQKAEAFLRKAARTVEEEDLVKCKVSMKYKSEVDEWKYSISVDDNMGNPKTLIETCDFEGGTKSENDIIRIAKSFYVFKKTILAGEDFDPEVVMNICRGENAE